MSWKRTWMSSLEKSNRVLTDTEISLLSKGLSFCPTPKYIDHNELEADLDEFARKVRCKWYFKDSPTDDFSETPAFRTKSKWQPPRAAIDARIEVFLSRVKEEILSTKAEGSNYPNSLGKKDKP